MYTYMCVYIINFLITYILFSDLFNDLFTNVSSWLRITDNEFNQNVLYKFFNLIFN